MYLIFNYAVGGWPGVPSLTQWGNGATRLQIQAEWIHEWEKAPTSSSSTWTYSGTGAALWDTAGNWFGQVPDYKHQSVVLSTLAGRPTMEIQWTNSRTVGSISLSGNTIYTLGQASGAVESIMFADQSDGVANMNLRRKRWACFQHPARSIGDLSAVNNTSGA